MIFAISVCVYSSNTNKVINSISSIDNNFIAFCKIWIIDTFNPSISIICKGFSASIESCVRYFSKSGDLSSLLSSKNTFWKLLCMLGKSTSTVKCLKIQIDTFVQSVRLSYLRYDILLRDVSVPHRISFSFKAIDPCHFCNLLFSFLEQKETRRLRILCYALSPSAHVCPFRYSAKRAKKQKRSPYGKLNSLP